MQLRQPRATIYYWPRARSRKETKRHAWPNGRLKKENRDQGPSFALMKPGRTLPKGGRRALFRWAAESGSAARGERCICQCCSCLHESLSSKRLKSLPIDIRLADAPPPCKCDAGFHSSRELLVKPAADPALARKIEEMRVRPRAWTSMMTTPGESTPLELLGVDPPCRSLACCSHASSPLAHTSPMLRDHLSFDSREVSYHSHPFIQRTS